jgi:hypothetical protein
MLRSVHGRSRVDLCKSSARTSLLEVSLECLSNGRDFAAKSALDQPRCPSSDVLGGASAGSQTRCRRNRNRCPSARRNSVRVRLRWRPQRGTARISVVHLAEVSCHTVLMARPRKSRLQYVAAPDDTPDDLYDYARPPARRPGRPAMNEPKTWTVKDDRPEGVAGDRGRDRGLRREVRRPVRRVVLDPPLT